MPAGLSHQVCGDVLQQLQEINTVRNELPNDSTGTTTAPLAKVLLEACCHLELLD